MASDDSDLGQELEAAVRAAFAELGLDALAREVDEALHSDRDEDYAVAASERTLALLRASRRHLLDRAALAEATALRLDRVGLQRVRFVDEGGVERARIELGAAAPSWERDREAAERLADVESRLG